MRLHGIEQGVDTDEGECLPDAGDQDDVANVMRRGLHFFDEGEVVGDARQVLQDERRAFFLLKGGDFVRDALVLADVQKYAV